MEKLKVLIPTDFSEQPGFALVYAENLSQLFEVEIVLLHVLEVNDAVNINSENVYTDMLGVDIEYLQKAKEAAVEKLKIEKNSCESKFAKVDTIIKVGPLTDTIVSASEEAKVDFILMGTKGASGLREWLSGSETQIIARHSNIPVLTVMCDRKDEGIKNILLISDFTDLIIPPDPLVMKFVQVTGATLHLLCIAKKEIEVGEVMEHMKTYVGKHNISKHEIHIHHDRKVYQGITHFTELDSMHLVIIGTHGRSGIQQLVNSSIAEKLINHLYKPVLVYKI